MCYCLLLSTIALVRCTKGLQGFLYQRKMVYVELVLVNILGIFGSCIGSLIYNIAPALADNHNTRLSALSEFNSMFYIFCRFREYLCPADCPLGGFCTLSSPLDAELVGFSDRGEAG